MVRKKLNQNSSDIAVSVEGLHKEFIIKKAIFSQNRVYLKAVKDVSFSIKRGESFGIVGESGSGKSTIARLIAGLTSIDKGSIRVFGQEITNRGQAKEVSSSQRDLQIVFQDP